MAQPTQTTAGGLPEWAHQIVESYNSHTHNQFVLTGNVHDLYQSPGSPDSLATLPEFVQAKIVPRFDVILTYDIGNGIQVSKGREVFGKWNEKIDLDAKHPRQAIEVITHFLRYVANLAMLGQVRTKVAIILIDGPLTLPDNARSSDVNATAFLVRGWSREPLLLGHDIATFILAENFSDLHPLLRQNQQSTHLDIPLPQAADIQKLLEQIKTTYPTALREMATDFSQAAQQWIGTTFRQILNLLKLSEHQKTALRLSDLAAHQAALIEQDCAGLLEFLKPRGSLDRLHGQENLIAHLRQNLELWRKGESSLIPMGYLISGPVGTGKTFLVKCLAGEASVPVLVLKNFRDKWYGSTEGNLEKIFRTLRAMNRCYVFIDEADQTLGKRDSGGSEPGVSGRIYSMLAQEMSNKENRGKIVWILASSRPDLIEVDLKRPGRIDLKIPLFPTSTPEEGFHLLQSLANQHGFELKEELLPLVYNFIPDLLTPGEADSLIADLKREVVTTGVDMPTALSKRLWNYLRPIPLETIQHQMRLAMQECSRAELIPERFRKELL